VSCDAVCWAIEADAVGYTYPDGAPALTEVSLHVAPGEFVAVAGPNGAGKSTLLRLLVGLLQPHQGQVRMHGVDIAGRPAAERYRRVGIVFQNPVDQLFAATVEEDVAFGPRNLSLSEAEVTARVDQALAAVDASELRGRHVRRLSFGQQRRVCLAGVLAMQPDVLVLDEPLAGLDPGAESRMIRLLADLHRREGKTVIVSTHAVDLLPVLAQRVYVLCDGRLCLEGTPAEVFRDPSAVERAGLRLPLIAQLFQSLGEHLPGGNDNLPLTVDEARCRLLRWRAEVERGPQATGTPAPGRLAR
jgi:cobalt transport protein ATP-binding subunit